MVQTMTKYWYVSPISVLCVDEEDTTSTFLLRRGDIVQGWIEKGDTNATSKLQIGKVGNRDLFGNVELPLDRFKEFDLNHAYMEE